jgi:hypothetical protein
MSFWECLSNGFFVWSCVFLRLALPYADIRHNGNHDRLAVPPLKMNEYPGSPDDDLGGWSASRDLDLGNLTPIAGVERDYFHFHQMGNPFPYVAL